MCTAFSKSTVPAPIIFCMESPCCDRTAHLHAGLIICISLKLYKGDTFKPTTSKYRLLKWFSGPGKKELQV